MRQALLNMFVFQLGITSLSVQASHTTHRQTQSGSIRFKNFQVYLSLELAHAFSIV